MRTAHDIIEQAHCNLDLIGGFEDVEEDTLQWDEYLKKLWEQCVYIHMLDNDVAVCTLEELEEEFNQPRGCPTGGYYEDEYRGT